MRLIFKMTVTLILLTVLLVSCGPSKSEELFNKAVAKEYKIGTEKTLPLFKQLVEKYPDSKEATKAREKILAYKKAQKALKEKKRLEEEKKKLEAEKRRLEEERRRQEEERRRQEELLLRREAERRMAAEKKRRQELKKIASYKLSNSQAYELVSNDCGHIRSRASFTISSRCEFTIQEVATFGEGKEKVAKISVYSRGFLYDITFTVYYGLVFNEDGDYLPRLLQVRKGRFSGLSDIAREFLKNK